MPKHKGILGFIATNVTHGGKSLTEKDIDGFIKGMRKYNNPGSVAIWGTPITIRAYIKILQERTKHAPTNHR